MAQTVHGPTQGLGPIVHLALRMPLRMSAVPDAVHARQLRGRLPARGADGAAP